MDTNIDALANETNDSDGIGAEISIQALVALVRFQGVAIRNLEDKVRRLERLAEPECGLDLRDQESRQLCQSLKVR